MTVRKGALCSSRWCNNSTFFVAQRLPLQTVHQCVEWLNGTLKSKPSSMTLHRREHMAQSLTFARWVIMDTSTPPMCWPDQGNIQASSQELSPALTGAQPAKLVQTKLTVPIQKMFLLWDSTVVLQWIRATSHATTRSTWA